MKFCNDTVMAFDASRRVFGPGETLTFESISFDGFELRVRSANLALLGTVQHTTGNLTRAEDGLSLNLSGSGLGEGLPGGIAIRMQTSERGTRMLAELAGHEHRVLTAVALRVGPKRLSALSISRVTFAAMTTAQIEAYVATGEPLGKAGAYGIQGRAAAYVEHLAGSYSGIMGLPMYETAQLLRAAGFAI